MGRYALLFWLGVDMEKLFECGRIGAHKLKNRTIMTSLTTNLSHDTGEISQRDLAFYKARIDGGVGAIITGMMRVDDYYGNKFPYQPSATHSKYIRGLKMLAELAHESDVKIFAQLNHPGAQTFRELNHHLQQVSAVPRKPEFINQRSREMTNYEIGQMIKQFVRSAIILEQAGFDGIEIHAGHGYLLHSFLLTSRGPDILTKLIRDIKAEVSEDFAIILRFNFDDFDGSSANIDHYIDCIKKIDHLPIDALDITCGVYESMYTICDAKYYPNRWKDEYIRRVREASSLPLIANNNIKTPAESEDMLAADMVDFIGLGRPLLADPAWVAKAQSGAPIAPCISCSHCFKSINEFKPIQCPVNPHLSRESLRDRTYNESNADKTMVVIGAGPAGLQMAISLAEKGYHVVLFEKENRVGGKLNVAAKTSDKYRIVHYVDYLENKISELNIDTRLNTVADIEEIKALDPYQVFIATGAVSENLTSSYAYSATDILNDRTDLSGKNVLIIGAGENGLELAETIENATSITIAEATNMVGREMEYGERMMLVKKLAEKNIEILTDTKVRDVANQTVTFDHEGDTYTKDFDAIIKTIRPVTDLLENSDYLTKLTNPIIIGDADKIGKIYDATSKAVEIGSRY